MTLDLDRLYAGVEDEEAFLDVPGTIAAACGARSGMLLYQDGLGSAPSQLASYWQAKDYARYFTEFTERDPWSDAHYRYAGWNGAAIAADDILPPSAFMQTRFYNELIAPLGDDTARCLGLVLRQPGVWLQIGVHRAGRDRPFTAADVAALNDARDHATRMLRLRRLLREERTGARHVEAMAEASGRAILLVDRHLRIARSTKAAVAILDADDGLACRAGRLTPWSSTDTSVLCAMVQETIAASAVAPSTMLIRRRGGGDPYRVRVLPGGRTMFSHALVVVDDPARDRAPDIHAFAAAYGLTPAECALAVGLTGGRTLDEMADERHVTRETIRSQLKSLLARTGTARQAELVRLFATLPHG